jgi:hypothetical protein
VSAYGGGTGIAVPLPLQSLGLPGYLELGVLYKVCSSISGKLGWPLTACWLSFCVMLKGIPI